VRGDVSSQFLTALLMACRWWPAQDIVIESSPGELISRPYIEITLNLLARFGVAVQRDGWQRFTIPAGSRLRSPGDLHVEADASSASYFIALGAIAPSNGLGLRIQGVGADSIQGDIRFIDAARHMGAQVVTSGPNWLQVSGPSGGRQGRCKAIDLDCNHIPDAAMTLAVMALYADGTTTLRNIASWRVKETDRIAAMAAELRKFGATVEEGPTSSASRPRPAQPTGARQHPHLRRPPHGHVPVAGGVQSGRRCRCASKTRNASPRPFRTTSRPCSRWCRRRSANIPVICVDGPTASGKGTLAAELARGWATTSWIPARCTASPRWPPQRAGLALDASGEEPPSPPWSPVLPTSAFGTAASSARRRGRQRRWSAPKPWA
jgi:3-phosphoshikimate 1-carboxyvinyltransferase